MPRNTSMAWLRSKTIESSDAGRVVMHYLREAALGEQIAHALRLSAMLAKLKPLRQKGASCGLACSGLGAQSLRHLLIAHRFDAGGEGLEQLERHLFLRCDRPLLAGPGSR